MQLSSFDFTRVSAYLHLYIATLLFLANATFLWLFTRAKPAHKGPRSHLIAADYQDMFTANKASTPVFGQNQQNIATGSSRTGVKKSSTWVFSGVHTPITPHSQYFGYEEATAGKGTVRGRPNSNNENKPRYELPVRRPVVVPATTRRASKNMLRSRKAWWHDDEAASVVVVESGKAAAGGPGRGRESSREDDQVVFSIHDNQQMLSGNKGGMECDPAARGGSTGANVGWISADAGSASLKGIPAVDQQAVEFYYVTDERGVPSVDHALISSR
jgi:hypothetical protein